MTLTELKLIERIMRAKIKLENVPRIDHKSGCLAEDGSGYPVACKCGADKTNQSIREALLALSLENLSTES